MTGILKANLAGISPESWEIDSHNMASPLPEKTIIITYCQKGLRSLQATQMLKTWGWDRVFSLDGGLNQLSETESTWFLKEFPN